MAQTPTLNPIFCNGVCQTNKRMDKVASRTIISEILQTVNLIDGYRQKV